MSQPVRLLIFTDLNDTLLDRNYDFSAAKEALRAIKERDIPLIITTSKTRAQTEIYRSRLGISYPIIAENGAAIYFSQGSFPAGKLPPGCIREGEEFVWELSRRVEGLIPELQSAADAVGAEIEIIFDMSRARIMEVTGMDEEESELAKHRTYIVYFLCHSHRAELIEELKSRGLKITWGSYFMHLGSTNDKGLGVHRLTALYREQGNYGLLTAGFGDNMNDLNLFRNVNMPFLAQHPDGSYADVIEVENLVKLEGVGPEGWNRGVLELIESMNW